MIEAFKDMKRGKDSYESIQLERTASQILHHIEDKDGDDSLESVRGRVLGRAQPATNGSIVRLCKNY